MASWCLVRVVNKGVLADELVVYILIKGMKFVYGRDESYITKKNVTLKDYQ